MVISTKMFSEVPNSEHFRKLVKCTKSYFKPKTSLLDKNKFNIHLSDLNMMPASTKNTSSQVQ